MSNNYYADVSYNLWHSGHSADLDRDMVSDYKSNGYSAEEAANAIIRREEQAAARHREALMMEMEQEYPEQQPEEEDTAHD